jgi:hypothetical protein
MYEDQNEANTRLIAELLRALAKGLQVAAEEMETTFHVGPPGRHSGRPASYRPHHSDYDDEDDATKL